MKPSSNQATTDNPIRQRMQELLQKRYEALHPNGPASVHQAKTLSPEEAEALLAELQKDIDELLNL